MNKIDIKIPLAFTKAQNYVEFFYKYGKYGIECDNFNTSTMLLIEELYRHFKARLRDEGLLIENETKEEKQETNENEATDEPSN